MLLAQIIGPSSEPTGRVWYCLRRTFSDYLHLVCCLQAGVERIIVNGRVRFQFRPLLGELPIIGGMQVQPHHSL